MAYSTTQLVDKLKTRRDAIIDELNALSTSTAGGLPNVTGDGVNVDHQGYKKGLYDELQAINKQLAQYNVGIVRSEVR